MQEALEEVNKPKEKKEVQENKKLNLIRAVFIILDLTQSMQIKDFKPSRLSISLQMIKNFIKKAKDSTPVVKFSLAVVEQEKCKRMSKFVYKESDLYEKIDQIKVKVDGGFFSLENSLSIAIDNFDKIPDYFHKYQIVEA